MNSINIAWWNTGIAPPVDGVSPKDPDESLRKGIIKLCLENDIVFLGEYRDIPDIKEAVIQSNSHGFVDLFRKDNRVFFNTAIFYKKNNIDSISANPEYISQMSWGQYRIAIKISIRFCFSAVPFDFYIVHWNQYRNNDDRFCKQAAANLLGNSIEQTTHNQDSYVICIGDFNLEPYDEIFSHLRVSRDLNYARKYVGFYNPFWNWLSRHGTIRCVNHKSMKCFTPTFDQAFYNQKLVKSGIEIQSEVLTDFYSPKRSGHWPIQIILTTNNKEKTECLQPVF